MSEQEIREGMLLAVWDEPPLDFDPDKLMRRAEQKKSRRRALVSVGVATAMIVVSAFALPGLLPRGANNDNQLAADQTQSSVPPPSESESQRAERIGVQLAEKLALTMPDLKEVYGDLRVGTDIIIPPSSSALSTTARKVVGSDLTGYVLLTDVTGPTALSVIGSKGISVRNLCVGAYTCRDVPQKDGTTVTEAVFREGAELTRAVSVRIFQSGYAVQITSSNYNPATGSGLRQTIPVPVDVLTTLVTDPRIRWE